MADRPERDAPSPRPEARVGGASCAIAAVVLALLVEALGWRAATPGAAPLIGATSVVAAIQLAASVAGRGRRAPGAWLGPWIRLALAGLLTAALIRYLVQGKAPLLLGLLITAAFTALAEVGSRLRGPSAVAAVWLASELMIPLRIPWSDARALAYVAIEVGSFTAVVLALRRLGLDRERLARLGVTPWAPSEIGLIPFVAGYWLPWLAPLPAALRPWAPGALQPAIAVAIVLALASLDRRLRAAEARAARSPGSATR